MFEQPVGVRLNETGTMRIRFDFGFNTMYHLGCMATDLNQLLILSSLMEEGRFDLIREGYEDPRYLMRNSSLMEYSDRYPIVSVQDGSIEILLSGIGLAAGIIMPLVAIYVTRRCEDKDLPPFRFEIESEYYDQVEQWITTRQNRPNGFDEDQLQNLFEVLRANGYHVQCGPQDAYIIVKTLDRICRRTVRLVERGRRRR